MLTLCRELDIQCKLVWMPEYEEIRSQYHPFVESKVERFLAKLKQEFGVESIKAREWVDNLGFYDGFHLNRAGAKQFTQELFANALAKDESSRIARQPSVSTKVIR